MLSTGSGKGCNLLGLGDCLGASVGEAAAVGCSSMGEVFCGRMSGGNIGVCPNRMWYEVARVPLSCGGPLYKMTWQAERKTFWASTSQVALEQAASASWTKWPLVVLAFLTTTRKSVLASRINWEQAVQASRVAWEQMTLASLMWPLETHSGRVLHPVPKQLSVSWHLWILWC